MNSRRRVNSAVRWLPFMNSAIPAALVAFLIVVPGCHRSKSGGTFSQRSPTSSSTNFERTGLIDMFAEAYRRTSDGATVMFHCSDRPSDAKALLLVRNERDAPLVEKTD